MAFTDLEIRNAWNNLSAQGMSADQIYQVAQNNLGLARSTVDSALANTSRFSPEQVRAIFAWEGGPNRTFTTSTGQTFSFNDLIPQILARYQQGKNPALVVKSALQLGVPKEIILQLPGVTQAAFDQGQKLITSGAFAPTATGSEADEATAAPVGSAMYNARIANGLDAFGFPPEEVALLKAQGLYGPGKQFDPTPATTTATAPVTQPQPVETLTPMQQRAEEMGGQNFNQQVVPTGSNLSAADIAWLQQGQGMFGNPALYDPTSPLSWATASGMFVPATDFLFQAAANALGATPSSVVAADATQLAKQGLSEAQIASTLQNSYGLTAGTAGSIAAEAASGASTFQIAQDFSNLNLGTTTTGSMPSVPTSVTTPTTTTPGTITVTGQPVTSAVSSALPAAITAGLLTGAASAVTPTTTPAGTITVTGQPVTTTTSTPASSAANILAGQTGQVTVQGTPTTTTSPTSTSAVNAGNILAGQTGQVTVQGSTPGGTQTTSSPGTSAVTAGSVLAGQTGTTQPGTTTETKPADKKDTSIFTPSDILKILGLLGTLAATSKAGTGTGTGTGTVVTPRSDAAIGSTTPQFGEDYYAAIQRYYNTFMPETPRDVAGPLKQWYENTYGA